MQSVHFLISLNFLKTFVKFKNRTSVAEFHQDFFALCYSQCSDLLTKTKKRLFSQDEE